VTLRHRIAAAAGIAVAVAVLSSAVIVYFAVRSELRSQVEHGLSDTARRFGGAAPPGRPGGLPEAPPPGRGPRGPDADGDRLSASRPELPFGGAAGFIQRVRSDGSTERPRDESQALPVTQAALAVARRGEGRLVADMHVGGHHLRVLTVGIGPAGAFQVARPLEEVDSELHRVLLVLILVGAAGIALAAALGAFVARTALGPIRRFTERTEALSAEADVSQRMEVTGNDELARLAHSFNTTLDALERSVEAQRHLVADASHELRTPIASLRANIQVLEDADRLSEADLAALRADVVAELDELTALVADIVELARGTKAGTHADDVRLDRVVDELVERLRRRAGAALVVEARLEPTVVSGDPERIGRAVSNLLDNARKWSPPGGTVEIALERGVLTVRDHGPGFAAEDLPHVFERFYRAERARGMSGSGLGLAIVRQTAEAHGGSVEAANAEGGGALIRLRFGDSSVVDERGALSDAGLREPRPSA
jgi:two-component system sensor histidine kinase MprB